MERVGRVWEFIAHNVVDGAISAGVGLFFMLLDLADYFDAVNVRPVLEATFGVDRASQLMVYLPIFFMSLRFLSHNGDRWHHRHDHDCNTNEGGH